MVAFLANQTPLPIAKKATLKLLPSCLLAGLCIIYMLPPVQGC